MDNNAKKKEYSKKIEFSDILKIIGVLAIIIPLFLGYIQYKQSVRQDINNHFRNVVSKLTSGKKEDRLASATNLGTFIRKGEIYYDEAIDILINATSIEL